MIFIFVPVGGDSKGINMEVLIGVGIGILVTLIVVAIVAIHYLSHMFDRF